MVNLVDFIKSISQRDGIQHVSTGTAGGKVTF